MELDHFTIKKLKPGRVLDGHVHDLLGVPEADLAVFNARESTSTIARLAHREPR